MYIDYLKSGTRVQIQREGDGPTGGYMCKVAAFSMEERELLVHAPMEGNKPVDIEKGSEVTLRVLTDNAVYSFKATMKTFTAVDGFDAVKFTIVNEGEKIQRRSAFRFNCGIPITYSVISASGQESKREPGMLTDLSAGGTKIYSDKILQVGSFLNIAIELGKDLVVAFGDVRSKLILQEKEEYKYQYGIRFKMMPEDDQEKIIRYMYKLQREELKKARPL